MLKTLIIFLCFGANIHAGSFASSNLTPTTTAQEEVELAKIAATCLSSQDYEELGGNRVRHGVVQSFAPELVRESVATIGLAELRAALNFPPLPPWQKYNRTDPRWDEISAAPTLETYYDLREPRSWERSLNADFLLEHNMIPGIAFLDKRFPVIRMMFRRKFGEILEENQGVVDRKIVDRLIDEFDEIKFKLRRATGSMLGRFEECFDFS
ncbi:unnamed protein product [Caenorhabditis brenneri]